ncbi:hypothetical protein T03_7688 [Trichinella britovi]|uniref:Stress response protein NST1 n=1 Tax=Trichinella britovi TaxID=45882 RepID=A0A0V1D766_TRIBR|nr:hypothetical protein T03_7688 [Trichinella britovi]
MLPILFIALLAVLANPSESQKESQPAKSSTVSPEDVARIYCAAKKCNDKREKMEKAKESEITALLLAYKFCKSRCVDTVLESEAELQNAQKYFEKDYPKLVKERMLSDLQMEMEEEELLHKVETDIERQTHKDAVEQEKKRHKEAMKYVTKEGKKSEKEKHKKAKKLLKEEHKRNKDQEEQRHNDEIKRLKQKKEDLEKNSQK